MTHAGRSLSRSRSRREMKMGGHSRDGDSVDYDQTPDLPQLEGHEFIEHDDGEIDQDEGY